MTVLRVLFANKDPLLMYHMMKGGGEAIPYQTTVEFLEYLDVWEAIKAQGELEARQEHENKMREQQQRKR